jgi:hypothetical protein
MRKLAALVTLAALCVVGSAQAAQTKPPHPPKQHVDKPTKPATPNPRRCVARNVGYNASGKLVKAALTALGHGRYSGPLEVNLTRANHRASTKSPTFTLSDARVVFHHGVNPAALVAGSRVKLHGKITALPNKHCSTAGFTPTITVTKVDIRAAKA